MPDGPTCMPPSEDDLRSALKEMRTYVDITEDDLKKIYQLALRHAQERLKRHYLVKELMSTKVVTIGSDADVHEAARLLSEHKISGMPVVDEKGSVVGVLSEADLLVLSGMERGHGFRDVVRMLLGEQRPARPAGRTVADVMSAPPVICRPDDDVSSAARILSEKRIKRLPIVDEDGKLIGIISRADIVRYLGKE